MKKIFLVFALVLIGSTIFFGCSKKSIDTSKIVYAQASEGITFDPQDSTDNFSQRSIVQIYDRLVEMDTATGKVFNGLADSWKQVDSVTIVFNLNKNAKFHNGEPLTAEDVKFTIERAQSLPKVAFLYEPIKQVVVVDANTVKIITKSPFAPLLNHLSHKSSSIISKKYFQEKGKDYFLNPIGSGAYKFKERIVGDRVILAANEEYFKGAPIIKKVEIRSIPEENSKIIGLETGEITVAADLEGIGINTIKENKSLILLQEPSENVNYLGFNNKKGILKDKEVRRAISMAVDRDSIIQAVVIGNAKKANSFLAPSVFGYSSTAKIVDYNPAEAKKIIEQKKLVGTTLILGTTSASISSQTAEIIQAQLKEVGLNVEIQKLEWGAYLDATSKGKLDMFLLGWGPSTMDGDYGLYPNFHSSQISGGGNRAFYSNPKVDKLLENAKKEMNVEKRKKMYAEVQDIINNDAVLLPTYYRNTTIGIQKNIEGPL
ncbi:MAG: ABC transporter substrate-binding protein, partial [Fusobacteriaceae bacterium]